MTNQKADQAALDKLVDEFGWEWKQGDVYSWMNSDTVFIAHDEIHANNLNTEDGWQQKIKVYAGTWVEGRLRELMGEAFRGLHLSGSGKRFVCDAESPLFVGNKYMTHPKMSWWRDTPIQALVAALRVLKQKEVSGASTKGD